MQQWRPRCNAPYGLDRCQVWPVMQTCLDAGMAGHPPTPATPPCTGPYTVVRDGHANTSSNNEAGPSDLRYALESPTDGALAFARYQGPEPTASGVAY